MLHWANIPDHLRHIVAPMVIRTAARLDLLILITINGQTKTRYEHFYSEFSQFSKGLRTFGEAGTVIIKTSTIPKALLKGVVCMFVEYPMHHASKCWLMFNLKTKEHM